MSDEPSLSRRTEAWVDYVNSFTGLESLLQEAKEMQVDDEKLRLNTKMREITSYSYEPKLEVRGLLWLSYAVLERQLRSASYSLPDRMEERWDFLNEHGVLSDFYPLEKETHFQAVRKLVLHTPAFRVGGPRNIVKDHDKRLAVVLPALEDVAEDVHSGNWKPEKLEALDEQARLDLFLHFDRLLALLGSLSSSKHELDVQEIQAVDADLAAAAAEERSQLVDGAKEGEQQIGTSKWYY